MLEVARAVQRRFDAPLPGHITDVYRGHSRIILSLSEIDPYRGKRNEAYAGLFEFIPPPVQPPGSRFYAYLAGGNALTWGTVDALLESGLPGAIHVRNAGAGRVPVPSDGPVQWLVQPPDVVAACRAAAVVVHHGGPGTAMPALLSGRPQILLPGVSDQFLTANFLRELPFSKTWLTRPDSRGITDFIDAFLTVPRVVRAAMDFAGSIRSQGLHDARRQIVKASLQALS